MADLITFYAAIAKIQTLVDGGIRIYLDLPEDAIMAAAELMAYKASGVAVDVVMTAKSLTELDNEAEKEAEGGGSEMDRRRITIRRDQ